MAFLDLHRLEKSFGETRVLRGVSLAVEGGEIFALLGPSGSGKTTLLRLLAGFETLDAGAIRVAGQEVSGLPPARRRFGMVFQHYALFPHLTVGENVAFGLHRRGTSRGAIRRRVAEVLELVDLAGFQGRRVTAISGGQQQRVALARALAPEPRLLLLDEPLSNLDPALRERTRRAVKEALRQVGITTVLVTHEQEEAFDFGDRVGVLHRGRLEQEGYPEELYREPASRFVATFVGRASLLAGRFRPPDGLEIPAGEGRGGVVWRGVVAGEVPAGGAAELVVRPESLALAPPGEPGALAGTVRERRYAGAVTYLRVALEAGPELEVMVGGEGGAVGERVALVPRPGAAPPRIFPPEEEGR